jgi:hypothetical protein
MTKHLLFGTLALLLLLETASAQYPDWKRSGSFYILTTPEGANLPAAASEENFPLLVRLNKEVFNFSEAQPHGEDLRFSAGGQPLPYQIDVWDATHGAASIWVKIPVIKGNARQEIKLHWGKADAASESSASAVFNATNGYVSVFHMNDPVRDELGTVVMKDVATMPSEGMIGQARNFAYARTGGNSSGQTGHRLSSRLCAQLLRGMVQAGRRRRRHCPGWELAGGTGDRRVFSPGNQCGLLRLRRFQHEQVVRRPMVPCDTHLYKRRFTALHQRTARKRRAARTANA